MAKKGDYSEYPDIHRYALEEGISAEVLHKAFKIESYYHEQLIREEDFDKRMSLYNEFYSTIIPLYRRDVSNLPSTNPKDKYVSLFKKELTGKSIIDFGCGQGHMLQSIARQIPIESLVGVDVLIPADLKVLENIEFRESNIIDYRTAETFDIAISDNVIEHLVSADAIIHLKTLYDLLEPDGSLILMMPNRLFGPADVTRIKDFSHSGRLAAEGGHVNESTYSEMIECLKKVGFRGFSTVLPVPKLKYTIFKHVRIGTRWIRMIEKSNFLLSLFRKIKVKGVCPIRFTVTIIAQK